MYFSKTTNSLDASVTSSTDAIEIFKGTLSIQPIQRDVTGNPTYTLEVSNNLTDFVDYNRLSTNVAMDDSVEIHYTNIPWKYVRLTVTPGGGSTGTILFIISQN